MSEIESLSFHILKDEEVELHSGAEITNNVLFDEKGAVGELGPLDSLLGVDSQYDRCKICDLRGGHCIGHEGHIKLALPVIHPGLRNIFKKFIKGVCISCKRYTLKKNCPVCDKKLKYTFNTPYIIKDTDSSHPINIHRLYEAFKEIPEKEYKIFFKETNLKPTNLFLEHLIVPAITIRPNLRFDNKFMIDDLTRKISTIISLNQRITKHLETGELDLITEEIYHLLCYEIFTYMDNKLTNLPVSSVSGGKPIKSLLERLESKEGLLRANLRGKRTNYAARCVFSPDSNLDLSQVGIPKLLAKSLTKPIIVTKYNMEQVKKWINSEDYVSANYYDSVTEENKSTLKISDLNRKIILEKLKIGDVVHRHLMTGDYVVLCRAPVIHRYGLMGHKVVIYDSDQEQDYTIKINPTICLPYNADFDGDEGHVHSPQSQSAQIDVQLFMNVNKNLRDSKGGYPIVGLQKELITSIHMLTKTNPTFTRTTAIELLGVHFEPSDKKEYTGRDLISMCLPKAFNFNEQGIVIKDGQYIEGILTKQTCSRTSILSKRLMVYTGSEYKNVFIKLEKLARNYHKYLDHSVSVYNYLSEESTIKELGQLKANAIEKIEKGESVSKVSKEFQLKSYNVLQNEVTSDHNKSNPAIIMGSAGSSGSLLNLNQMRSCIGTRLVRGTSTSEYFEGLYPDYTGSLAKAKLYKEGIIWGNYATGLNYLDYINDSIHARDTNITNQLKITHMGYFSRRLLSALSDLYVDKDNYILDGKGRIIQHRFGGSGVNLEDYTTQVEEPEFKALLTKKHFSTGEPETINYTQLRECVKNKGYDSKLADIILCNTTEDLKFSSTELEHICKYLLIPIGTPIGISTGHAISEPSVQLTLSSKHKLTGSQTTLERLVDLIDRSLVTPQIHLIADTPEGLKILNQLKPVYLKDKYEINIDLNKKTISINNCDLSYQIFDKITNILKKYLSDASTYVLENKDSNFSLLVNSEVPFKCFYNILKQLKYLVICGSSVIKNHVMENNRLILEGSKNTIQLYKYIDKLEESGILKDVKIEYMDPVYLQQRKGIESARKLLYLQLIKFLDQGINIDPRYFSLFTDLMSYNGVLSALNRSGVIKMKSALTRASFEATKTTIYNLALSNQKDTLKSPISSIIINKIPPVGSNKFNIEY